MRYQYFVDFRHGISVFANFSYGIAVLRWVPPNVPLQILFLFQTKRMSFFTAVFRPGLRSAQKNSSETGANMCLNFAQFRRPDVTVTSAFLRFGRPHSQNLSDMGIP